ncbi:MAG: hypothetical protein BYD32DRAFT_439875 [Podila humilis]|nr:MAG: hypothetical protein BYD32DRAFT_439875 [Podila humilis]
MSMSDGKVDETRCLPGKINPAFSVDFNLRTYISDRVIKLITDVPICLMIASEALKHEPLTDKIYATCLGFLVTATKPQKRTDTTKINDTIVSHMAIWYLRIDSSSTHVLEIPSSTEAPSSGPGADALYPSPNLETQSPAPHGQIGKFSGV